MWRDARLPGDGDPPSRLPQVWRRETGATGVLQCVFRRDVERVVETLVGGCQQTFVDTYTRVAHAKLYNTKTPITSADLLNDRVVPFFEENGLCLLRILTDRGTEYCGKQDSHDYQLFLAIHDIDHTRTKAKSPQTNGICERFHETILNEFYQTAFRKKLYRSIDELQADLDVWVMSYNMERTHQGKHCDGRTPMETFLDGI